MTNYYKDQMRAYKKIDEIIENTTDKIGTDINKLTLYMTTHYPISPKAVKNRINLYVEANKEKFEIRNGEVFKCPQ